jgi:hypothetical protein
MNKTEAIERAKDAYRMVRAYISIIKSMIVVWYRYTFDKSLK